MRRIYESDALSSDDEDPFVPNRRERRGGGSGGDDDARSIRWGNVSHALMPTALRRRAVAASVETDRETYAVDDVVRFRVAFVNRLPFPVALRTDSPVRWTWWIDDAREASRVDPPADDGAPAEGSLFRFGRSERKLFHRRWRQRFRESDDEWSAARRGEYVLRAAVNDGTGDVAAETTFRIE